MRRIVGWTVVALTGACTGDDQAPPVDHTPRFVDRSDTLPPVPVATGDITSTVGGIGSLDVDGDGDPDLVVVSDLGGAHLLINDGSGQFHDATASSGLDLVFAPVGVASADVDDDGDPDLYIGGRGTSYLLLNDGGGHFSDETATWLPEDADNTAVRGSATFGDFDQDGHLDLYQANLYTTIPFGFPNPPNWLYRNTGSSLSRIADGPASTVDDVSATLVSAWHDFDDNGTLDLWVVNDWGPYGVGNQLFLNQGAEAGWTFVESSERLGYDQSMFGMAASLGDVDNDGDLDGYVTNVARNALLIRDETGHVQDQAAAFGVGAGGFDDPVPHPGGTPVWPDLDPESSDRREAGMAVFCETYCDPENGQWVLSSWTSLFFDADHDGWLDLFLTNGIVDTGVLPDGRGHPNQLYLRTPGGFELADPSVFPTFRGTSRGATALDMDGDGDMDIAWVDNGMDGPAGVRLAENRLARGHWVQIALDDTQSANRQGIGARITLVSADGVQVREIDGGRELFSFSQRIAHFGLGDATAVEAVEVRWPDGMIEVVDDVAVDARTLIRR